MKKMGWILVAALAWGGWCACAQEMEEEAKGRDALAEELLESMQVRQTIEDSFVMMKKMMADQMAKVAQASDRPAASTRKLEQSNKMMDMVAEALSWDNIKADYITLYASTFTEDEMKGLIAFYESPVGKAFVEKQPELMQRSMALSQQLMMDIMPKIQVMMMQDGQAPAEGE